MNPIIKCVAFILAVCMVPAMAQSGYPDRPIRWIIPNAAGGGTDNVARIIASTMEPSLGQPLIIENKPGAASMIAASILARSKPDGYTMLTGDNATFATNTHLYKSLTYDPAKDFAYIGTIARFPLALVSTKSFPAKTVRELIDYVKANPGKVSYASPGVGLPHHLAMELLIKREALKMVHVPYKGSPAAVHGMLAGDVDIMFFDLVSGLPFITEDKIRAYAVASANRFVSLPDVPTMNEAGVKDFEVYAWQGAVVPTGTPAAVVNRLNKALRNTIKNPEVQKRLIGLGVEPLSSTPGEFEDYVNAESVRWGTLIKQQGLEFD